MCFCLTELIYCQCYDCTSISSNGVAPQAAGYNMLSSEVDAGKANAQFEPSNLAELPDAQDVNIQGIYV